jgi:two-component system response regulator FixJ
MANDSQIYVIDDDDAVRDSLGFALECAGFSVATYESARAFLDTISILGRGCIVTDVRMPEIGGIELLRRLNALNIDWPVIVITGQADVHLAIEAMRRGALDLIEKPCDDLILLGAVRTALSWGRSDVPVDADVTATRKRISDLSMNERQVLDGLVAGKSNQTIANELGIGVRALELLRANVMTKMQTASLLALVRTVLIATR